MDAGPRDSRTKVHSAHSSRLYDTSTITKSSIATTACVIGFFAPSIHQQKQCVSLFQFQVLRLRRQHNLPDWIRVSRVGDQQIVDALVPARVNVKGPQRGSVGGRRHLDNVALQL
jgi:hypothetical protein